MTIKELTELFLEKSQKYRKEIFYLHDEIIKYEEIIEELNNKNITKEAINLLYDKYRFLLNKKNYETYLPTHKADLFVLKERLKIFEVKYKNAWDVFKLLKYHQVVSPSLICFVKEELTLDGYSDVNIIKANEKIKIYNTNQTVKTTGALKSKDLYLISNLIDHGFYDYRIKKPLDNEKELMKVADNYIKLYQNNDFEMADKIINADFEYYNPKEIEHIYLHMLDYYQEKIYSLNEVVRDKDYYFDITILNDIKEDYKKIIPVYEHVKNNFDNLKIVKKEEQLEEEIVEPLEEKPEENKLYYSTQSEDADKCYFMRDLVTLRKEGLDDILTMLDDFKNGGKRFIKTINYGYIELKDDQIRIILKPMGNNNYSVIGTFIKKSDNLMTMYKKMYDRPLAEINDEYSKEVEEAYINYISENGRKGTR